MRANREKLSVAMARACMNTKDVAIAAGLPAQTVNGLIRGRSVRPATIGRVARALDVDVAAILEEVEI